ESQVSSPHLPSPRRGRARLPPLSASFSATPRELPSFPTRRSSDLRGHAVGEQQTTLRIHGPEIRHRTLHHLHSMRISGPWMRSRSEEHTSELQSREKLVCRLLLEKKNCNSHDQSTRRSAER